jgi:hypothetical protein
MIGISRSCWLAGAERSLLTLWVGGLWIVGYLVAPTLFASLDDRQLAGQLAGRLFHFMGYLGLVSGALLLMAVWCRVGRDWAREWRIWVLLAMLLLVALGSFVLQPMMQELKLQGIAEGSAQATRFGRLHGVSSLLYLTTSLLGLWLVSVGIRRGPLTGSAEER